MRVKNQACGLYYMYAGEWQKQQPGPELRSVTADNAPGGVGWLKQ